MPTHKEDMFYDGTTLHWWGHGAFKATSGALGHQTAAEQSVKGAGPIPAGVFSLQAKLAKKDGRIIKDPAKTADPLDKDEGVEHLPDVLEFGGRGYENFAWGPDRVRLSVHHVDNPANSKRSGFYLHDSQKGYSHGCIEVEPRFFQLLRTYIGKRGHKNRLYLRVRYSSKTTSTAGGTGKP